MEQTLSSLSPEEKIAALTTLHGSLGWKIMVEILEENKKWLEDAILSGLDPDTGERMTEKEQDEARNKRGLTIELLETPEKLIEQLKGSKDIKIINFDPYDAVGEEKK